MTYPWDYPTPAILAGILLLGVGMWLTARLYSPLPRWTRRRRRTAPPDTLSALWTAKVAGDPRALLREAELRLREWAALGLGTAPEGLHRRLRALERRAARQSWRARWLGRFWPPTAAAADQLTTSLDSGIAELDQTTRLVRRMS